MITRKQTFLLLLGLLALLAIAIVAISPLIALGSNQIIFNVVPALEKVSIVVFGN